MLLSNAQPTAAATASPFDLNVPKPTRGSSTLLLNKIRMDKLHIALAMSIHSSTELLVQVR